MINRLLLLTSIFLVCFSASAQPPEVIYQGAIAKDGYANNVSYGPFNIGFNFTFYGNSYSQFYASSNGLVTFGAGSNSATEAPIPSSGAPNNFIAPFWDDLTIEESGTIMYTTIGAAPNRKCVIQFRNIGFYPSPVFMGTFQVILYETTNIIQVQYRLIVDGNSEKNTGVSAVIGIENSDGTQGIQYSYHQAGSAATNKAISFTPDPPASSNYNVDDNAIYDGVFLTKSLALPEPGITKLVSPAQDAIIGVDHTFEWLPASNNSFYTLLISLSPDLADALVYYPGNNLSYDVTGLELDKTYYWGVFANNATSTTWCELKTFSTSSTPPLAALPRTIWTEQGSDRIITLQYTGGDGSQVNATVTSLPGQGALYQTDGNTRGVQITSVPTLVTNPERKLIYVADGTLGNNVGTFNFHVTDGTGNSPEVAFSINVNPQGVPNVLLAARGTGIEIQFDRPMNDPTGKETQFQVMIDGSPVNVVAVALKPGDPLTIVLALVTPLTGSEQVLVSYTKGDVSATTGGLLETFIDEPAVMLAQTINFPILADKTYGDPDYLPGASASGGGLIEYSSSNLQVATIVSFRIRITGAGNSIITAIQEGNETYAPARFERSLTVIQANQTITFDPIPQKAYGDPDFTISATTGSGLPVTFSSGNATVASISGNTITIHNAGTSVITATQPGNVNYNAAPPVQRTLTVNKVTLTVTADNATKPYLDPLPVFTYTITGFVKTEDLSVIDILPTPQTTATAASDVGTYPITFTGGTDNNYTFSFVNGSLTITQIGQTITFGELPASLLMGSPLTLNATSTSGLTVSFESLSPTIATITGNTFTGIARGTANIRAYHAGNINYLPSEVFASINITTSHTDILYLFTPNNDGFNDLWEIPNLTELGRCDVKVYNRWGKLVFADSNYNNDWDGTSEGRPLPEGAYVFIINSENQGVIKGTVNIIR